MTDFQQTFHRFYSVEVSLSLVAHLTSSDPQGFATDPCSIHGGTNLLSLLAAFSFADLQYMNGMRSIWIFGCECLFLPLLEMSRRWTNDRLPQV
jgi:hypothetical protein